MIQHVHYPGTYDSALGSTVIPVYCGNHIHVITHALTGPAIYADLSKGEQLRLPMVSANTDEVTCPHCQEKLAQAVEDALLNVRHLSKRLPGTKVWCGAVNVAQIRQYENEVNCRECLDRWRHL